MHAPLTPPSACQAGRALELLLLLDSHWSQNNLRVRSTAAASLDIVIAATHQKARDAAHACCSPASPPQVYPIVFLSSVSELTLEFAKSSLEWMTEGCVAQQRLGSSS